MVENQFALHHCQSPVDHEVDHDIAGVDIEFLVDLNTMVVDNLAAAAVGFADVMYKIDAQPFDIVVADTFLVAEYTLDVFEMVLIVIVAVAAAEAAEDIHMDVVVEEEVGDVLAPAPTAAFVAYL